MFKITFNHKKIQPQQPQQQQPRLTVNNDVNFNGKFKKVVNAYQLKYKNEISSGFGDYLRGCFALIQLCNSKGIEFDMDLSNHPISKFIEIDDKEKYDYVDKSSILRYLDKDTNHLSSFVVNSLRVSNSFFLFCINYPLNKDYDESSKNFIKGKIQPNTLMENFINDEMTKLGLIEKNFSVIHIRTGDTCLLQNKRLDNTYTYQILKYVSPLLNPNKKYLILSDNNEMKLYFKPFKNCIFSIKPIIHLSDSVIITDENLQNTLFDFYIMGKSSEICSVSLYDHGSGFSEWCSVIYNIPYKKHIIPTYDLKKMRMLI
jgi:hypothetical protein